MNLCLIRKIGLENAFSKVLLIMEQLVDSHEDSLSPRQAMAYSEFVSLKHVATSRFLLGLIVLRLRYWPWPGRVFSM